MKGRKSTRGYTTQQKPSVQPRPMQNPDLVAVQIEAVGDHSPQFPRGTLASLDRLRKLQYSAPLTGYPRFLGA